MSVCFLWVQIFRRLQSSAANIVSTASTSTEIPTGSEAVSNEPAKPSSLSAEKIRALTEREDVIQILFVAEQYLGKALSPIEINKLLYFYDELHFSTRPYGIPD